MDGTRYGGKFCRTDICRKLIASLKALPSIQCIMFPNHFQNAPAPPGNNSHAKFYTCSEHPDVPSFRQGSMLWKSHLTCGCGSANAAPSIIRPLPPSSGVDHPVTDAANLCSPSACNMINKIEICEKILGCHLTVDKGSDFIRKKLAFLSDLKVTKRLC